jgi:hypothetical protein
MYFKIEEISYNGYWCGCCQHKDRHVDVYEYDSLDDVVYNFPINLEHWNKTQPQCGTIEYNVYDLDGNLIAGWEVHYDSYKTKMKKIKYLKKFVGKKEDWEIYLDDKKVDQPLELVDLQRRRDFHEKELRDKEVEKGKILEQIYDIDKKIIEFSEKNSSLGESNAPIVNS